VVAQDRDAYIISGTFGEVRARIAGALRHQAQSRSGLPVVGDWVEANGVEFGSTCTIAAVLPRQNLFARREIGGLHSQQPIAANIDRLFVTVALDRDFNLRRIERYLAAAAAGGVPVGLALTKADLCADLEAHVVAAGSVASSAPIVALCTLDGSGFDELIPFRGPDRTLAFAGSSGVGKSTLINRLLGEGERLATGAIRASDGRGQHTTTRRELLYLADGTAVIDTPGMRELALVDAVDGVASAFDDVSELATQCRFRDCSHESEPGCAVRDGLDPARLQSWRKLRLEAAFEERKVNPNAAAENRRRWKAIHVANRKRAELEGRGHGR
jgi:ribosome biogenesis GTPase